MLSSDSDVVERIENLLPHGSGVNGKYYMYGTEMFPPDDDYMITVSNVFEEIVDDMYGQSYIFNAVYTYNTMENSLTFEYIELSTPNFDIKEYLEKLFCNVAKEYNKLYCNVEDNQKQENYGE